MKKNVFVIGTGTIGEPLIGLLADFKKKLGIDIFFHKRTPLIDEIAKVNSLIKRGAHLVVDPEKIEAFQSLGHEPVLNYEAALKLCDVVIDCTPAGNMAKELHYLSLAKKDKNKLFIAQGSEKGFGFPYAHGINDAALERENPQFIQVVSCNTHNIACLLKTVSQNLKDITLCVCAAPMTLVKMVPSLHLHKLEYIRIRFLEHIMREMRMTCWQHSMNMSTSDRAQ